MVHGHSATSPRWEQFTCQQIEPWSGDAAHGWLFASEDNNFHSLLYFSKQWDALSGPALACIPSSRLPLFLRSSVRCSVPLLTSLWRNQTWFSELIQQFSAPAGVNNTIVETTLRPQMVSLFWENKDPSSCDVSYVLQELLDKGHAALFLSVYKVEMGHLKIIWSLHLSWDKWTKDSWGNHFHSSNHLWLHYNYVFIIHM